DQGGKAVHTAPGAGADAVVPQQADALEPGPGRPQFIFRRQGRGCGWQAACLLLVLFLNQKSVSPSGGFCLSKAQKSVNAKRQPGGAAAGQAYTYVPLYTPAARRQGFAQDLDTAFTDFSRKQRKNVGGQGAVHRDRCQPQGRLEPEAAGHGLPCRHPKALAGAVEGLPADPVPVAAVEIVSGQGAADGGKVDPDLVGPPGDGDAGGQAEAVLHL